MSSSMSLLPRPPPPAAATARRGAGLPKSLLGSSEKPPPEPAPPPRPSSMVRLELKPCSTTSVEYFSTPCWSVHLRVCSWPSMYTLAPFFRYCSATLASPSEKITTRCHSVFSLRSPVPLSRHCSEVATDRLAMGRPSWVRRISGSLPRFPTKITLFTLPAIAALQTCLTYRASPLPAPAYSGPDPIRIGTGYRRQTKALPGYPHIAPNELMFQFCSGISGANSWPVRDGAAAA